MPFYNTGKYLDECLSSLLNQTYPYFEILLIDDSSSDRSLEIAIKYAKKDSRVQIYHQAHRGPGAARNLGIKLAQGKYISFLDSDDFFEPDMLEKLVQTAQKTDADIVFYDYFKFDTATQKNIFMQKSLYEKLVPEDVFNPAEHYDFLFHFAGSEAWKHFFKTDFVKQYNLKFGKNLVGEDIVFTMPARALAKRMFYLREKLVHYRVNSKTQLTRRKDTEKQLKSSYKKAWHILKRYKLHKALKSTFEERKKLAKKWLEVQKRSCPF